MSDLIIRPETDRDHAAVRDLLTAAFGQDSEARLVDALRYSEAFLPELSLVAEQNAEVVGYILFTRVRIVGEATSHVSLALAPMAVRPDLQRQGIGKRMIEAGLDVARKAGYDSVVVLGHDAYYPRFGFERAVDRGIVTLYDAPDHTFVRELQDGALTGISGAVRYAVEFSIVT